MMEIETDRLLIKRIAPSHREALITLIGDSEVARTLSNVPHPYTESDADWWIESVKAERFNLNVFRRDRLIGGAGLTARDDGLLELGYWIGKPFWGNGYATEACTGLLSRAKQELGHGDLVARVYRGNSASEAIVRKLGFVREGSETVYQVSTERQVLCTRFRMSLDEFRPPQGKRVSHHDTASR